MVEQARDISNQIKIGINKTGILKYQNVLVKSKHLMSTVQIILFLSGICFLVIQSFAFLEKSILVLYQYYCIQKSVQLSLLVLSLVFKSIQ